MVNRTECQVYLLGKLKYLMVNSEHTAESDEISTFYSVLNFQMKKNLNVAFQFSDVSIFRSWVFIPNLYQSACQTKSVLGIL